MTIKPNETNAEYHADLTHVGNSMLKLYAKSPVLYHRQYIAQSIERPPPTPAMVLGSAVHTLWLEPELFEDEFIVAPAVDRRTKVGKVEWARFSNSLHAETVIDDATHCKALNMAEAMDRSPIAKPLLDAANASIETPIRWQCKTTGLKLKAKPDIYLPAGMTDWNFCIDVKTTIDPSVQGFGRQCANFGYHRQGSFYLSGCEYVYSSDAPTRFIIIAVGSEQPHDVVVHYLNSEWIDLGTDTNLFYKKRLAASMKSGEWFAPETRTINEPKMPYWLKSERYEDDV